MLSRTFAALAVLLVPACLEAGDGTSSTGSALIDGTPEVIGLLAFLDDPGTTLEVLDDQVPLDARAAGNLIAHRDGADGAYGTSDDDRFDTVGEVDDVPWVGEVSIERMVAFAADRGFVPSGDDLLGRFDGVAFTVAEAERVLGAVNEYSDAVLQHEVPLDSRAVSGIIAARPILSMPELADVYYVGTAMLQRLKDYTAVPGPGERADCRGDFECPDGDKCAGIPHDESSQYGLCYDPSVPEGAWASCSASVSCNPGLVCVGEIAWGSGFCSPEWQRGVFENSNQRWIAPTGEVTVTAVVARGLATGPVDIAVTPDIRHDSPESLRITLRSPGGAESVMWDGPDETGDLPDVLTRNCCIAPDEMANGRWMLLIENLTGDGLGNIHGWTLEIRSQWD